MRVITLVLCFYLLSFTAAQSLKAHYPNIAANFPLETALLEASNAERAKNGLPKLIFDEQLALAARTHAKEMAVLNYFSHSSPTVGSQTPAARVASAGSALVYVGENIARMSQGNIAQEATNGWMNSPGHRANILEPIYTHVGYGTAQDTNGQTLIAQVFGYKPYKLISAQVSNQSQTAYQIVFNARVPKASTVLFTYGNEQSLPTDLNAGDNSIAHLVLDAAQVHIQGSILSVGGGFIIQDGGWLDVATASYQADPLATQEALSISGVTAYPQTQNVNDIVLQFDGVTNTNLAVFVGEEFQQNPNFNSGTLTLSIPNNGQNTVIGVGEFIEGNRVRVTHQIMIDNSSAQPVLVGTSAR